jgi:electron transfer flavoprotein alpha subunit
MGEVFVVVEHRLGEIRDISLEMLWKAGELAQGLSYDVTAILIGHEVKSIAETISDRADKIIILDDEGLRNVNADASKEILAGLIEESRPTLTLIGNTSWGMELAPCLAVRAGLPLATDCIDISFKDDKVIAQRQMYGGKIFSNVSFTPSAGYLITIRSGTFPKDRIGDRQAQIVQKDFSLEDSSLKRDFIEFVETAAGDVDIAQAELLISVGRGIGEEENIALVKELAEALNGVLSCSRPIVDKNWLPKYLQVGTSGKSVSPKVYIAVGISGAFQHLAGITGAGTVIAINKDPKAPIFRTADYGIIDDLFKIVPALKEKVLEAKKG